MASTEAASSERAVTPPRGTDWADAPHGVEPATPQARVIGGAPVRERDQGNASARTAVRPIAGVAQRSSRAAALLSACRPRQWSKNVLLLAAPGAAGVLLHATVLGRAALALVSFCMLSGCVYLLNDVHDRAEDAVDPRKARRPIAAGELPVSAAVVSAALLAAAGLGLAAAVRPAFAGMGAGYLALTGSYTLWWRGVAVADIVVVAGGFVLRAIAGGVATDVSVSRWFVIVTSFGALFLVAGKRYAELAAATGPAIRGSTRASLHAYSAAYLRFVMILAAAVAVGAYCLWAFAHRGPGVSVWYDLTILPFVMWLLRYALLVEQGAGGAPEELVLEDSFLRAMSFAWVLVFAGAVYVGG
jgi:decaprenyl-phosphate phosphoribosyltransferase